MKPMKSELIQFKRDQIDRKPRSITALEMAGNEKVKQEYKKKINP